MRFGIIHQNYNTVVVELRHDCKRSEERRRDTEKSWINSSRRAIAMIVQHLFHSCVVSLWRLFSCGFFGLAKCFYDTNMVSWFRINSNFCWLPAVKVFLTPQSITFHEPLPKKERLQITAHIFLRWFDENNFRLFFHFKAYDSLDPYHPSRSIFCSVCRPLLSTVVSHLMGKIPEIPQVHAGRAPSTFLIFWFVEPHTSTTWNRGEDQMMR